MTELTSTITERRRLTRNLMYQYIYDTGTPVSKQQIAATLGYSLPTVHQNIAELQEADLIRAAEPLKSTGGRPAIGYVINEKIRYAIGASVSSEQLRLLLTDLRQNEIDLVSAPLQHADGVSIGRQIREDAAACLKKNGIDAQNVLGIGVTFPAVLDPKKDEIVLSPTLGMKDIALKAIREEIPFPVFFDNDSTSGGTAEWRGLSPEERKKDFIYLFLENGIGGSIFINEKPYPGNNGRSAEFGHMCIHPNGRACHCGRKGCLEAYCSAYRFTTDLGVSAEEFFEQLAAGRADYRILWDEVLTNLAVAITNLRMSFDCDIILGGFVTKYMKPYMERLRTYVAEQNPFEKEGSSYIKLGQYPLRAGMMGVAWHFLNEFMEQI
ncbi:MAG: ROK family transcriptional regulator [Lachnospiraceae bacterium]|nr:ROK family transcriptional regulator [Lachnospiraceae bacterium]